MTKLGIEVETAGSLVDIDFAEMADYFGQPVDLLADLEGTALEWSFGYKAARISDEAVTALRSGFESNGLAGAHPITNRGGKGGQALTSLFVDTVRTIDPRAASYPEFPLSRKERKPSGTMSSRIVETIRQARIDQGYSSRYTLPKVVVAFVGDKPSDMKEADALSQRMQIPVVGIMVERFGNSDHPLDTLAGKRRKAKAAFEQFRKSSEQRFIR